MDPERPAPFRRLVHVPSLDVLRAFAVSIVVMSHIWEVAPYFHFREIFSQAGFLGVDLFFVISGFLITALLLQERQDSGRISFGRFYLRRALRLLPALFVMLAVYLVYASAARVGRVRRSGLRVQQRPGDPAVRHELARALAPVRRWATSWRCGRSPSRSSSTWRGRSSSPACSPGVAAPAV